MPTMPGQISSNSKMFAMPVTPAPKSFVDRMAAVVIADSTMLATVNGRI